MPKNKLDKLIKKRSRLRIALLIALMLAAFLIRFWDYGALSGGDDSSYAMLASLSLKEPLGLLYVDTPDLPILHGDFTTIRPVATLPIALSILVFGKTTFAAKLPSLLFSAFSVLMLYLLLRRSYSTRFSILACTVFTFLPISVAFTRTSFVEAQLVFFLLCSVYFYVRAIDESRPVLFYIAGFFVLLNMLSTNFRGLAPLACVIAYLYVRSLRKVRLRRWLKRKELQHLMYSSALFGAIYLMYLAIPSYLFDGSSVREMFINLFLKAANASGSGMPALESAKELAPLLYLTPFLGFILVPVLFGLYYALKKVRKPENALWAFWLLPSAYYFFQGQPYPIRTVVFSPAYSVLAVMGLLIPYTLFIRQRERVPIAGLISLTLGSYVLIARLFIAVFPAEARPIQAILASSGLQALYEMFLSYYWVLLLLVLSVAGYAYVCSRQRRRACNSKIVRVLIALFIAGVLLLNIILPVAMVSQRIGVYYRPGSIDDIGYHIRDDLDNEEFSCIAGIHSKTLTYHTGRYCLYYLLTETGQMIELAEAGELRYFLINLHYRHGTVGLGKVNSDMELVTEGASGSGFGSYDIEKYRWIMENTVDVTEEAGLSEDEPYFRLREYSG